MSLKNHDCIESGTLLVQNSMPEQIMINYNIPVAELRFEGFFLLLERIMEVWIAAMGLNGLLS